MAWIPASELPDEDRQPGRPAAGPGPRAALLCWALAAAGAWLVHRVPADFDEPLWLRWARACGDHPVRTPLALFLVAWGLGKRIPGPEPPGFDPGDGL